MRAVDIVFFSYYNKKEVIRMKKILLTAAAAVLLLLLLAIPAWAIPLDSGNAALNAQFQNGVTENGYDYVAFSPVKGEADKTKYPILVWLHGRQSGAYPRAQLQRYEFSNWASDEYQARFRNAGGCFLFAPRESRSGNNDWDDSYCPTLKLTIDRFIEANAAHIDTNRIYIAGYSTGGTMTWDMLVKYPDFFAAGMPLAAIYQPNTTAQLNKLKNVSLWIFTSDHDPYLINETADVRPTFDYLAGISGNKAGLRMTSFSEAFFADGTKKTEYKDGRTVASDDAEHYIWEAVTYDMFMADGSTPYVCAATIGADGNALRLDLPGDGVISWLSLQSKSNETEDTALSVFQRITLFFRRFFAVLREFFGGRFKG